MKDKRDQCSIPIEPRSRDMLNKLKDFYNIAELQIYRMALVHFFKHTFQK